MSVVTLQQAKDDLRVTHSDQDSMIESLIAASEAEAARFLNVVTLPDEADIRVAVLLLIRSKYSLEDARDMLRHRTVAEQLLQPHRVEMGV